MVRSPVWLAALALSATLLGCGDVDPVASSESSNVIDGKPATAYPFAALVDAQLEEGVGRCSGSLVAPRVVLTAAHCVVGASNFRITTPYLADGDGAPQVAWSTVALAYDWEAPLGTADPSMHDIALIVLDAAIQAGQYPRLVDDGRALGDQVRYVGRVNDGVLSDEHLYVGREVLVGSGEQWGWPYAYSTEHYVESGDSGGPVVFATDGWLIAGVDSGGRADLNVELFARVDLLHGWIQERLAEVEAGGAP